MRLLVAGILAMRVVGATDAAILDDLQQRAVAALHSIRHATTKAQADEQRGTLQRSLELSLGFGRITQNGSLVALLSTPERIDTRAPAILIVLPQGPRSSRTETLVNTLTHLGFIVLTLDLHARDYDLGVLLNGVAPEGLVQHAIRSALAFTLYKKTRARLNIGFQ